MSVLVDPLLEMQSISTFNDPNVTIWRLDNFADFHKQSIVGDFIASEPFAFEHPKLGLIGFYLRFEPKPIANANFTYLSMQLLNDHFQHSISMECNSWMEAIDKKRSQTKNVDFEFSKELTFKTWWFLSSEQVTEFAQSTSVFICCHLPYPVKSIGSISTNNIVYRWPITDFESRFNTAKLGISWKSDEFEVPGLKDVKLMVDFRPKGERKKYDDSSSIYLHATDLADHSKVPIHCVFWIENTESRLQKIEFTYVYYTMQSYGFPKYVKQEELLKFAENGPFDICCDVRAIIDPVPLPNRISFQSELASIFNDPYFSDAEIHVDNQIFKVSRAIISCKSPVFRAMFDKETTEQKSGVVTIKGFEVSMVEKMLIFIYKNEVVNLKECAAQLLPIADCYQVNDLLKKCTDSILDNLTIDNLLPILELAFEREHLEQFKYRVLKFAHQNCKEMQKLSKYESLLTRVPKIAIELLAIAYA